MPASPVRRVALLTWKNSVVLRRNRISSAGEILLPVYVVLWMWVIKLVFPNTRDDAEPQPPPPAPLQPTSPSRPATGGCSSPRRRALKRKMHAKDGMGLLDNVTAAIASELHVNASEFPRLNSGYVLPTPGGLEYVPIDMPGRRGTAGLAMLHNGVLPSTPQPSCEGAGCVQKYSWPLMFGSVFMLTCQAILATIGTEKERRLVDALARSGVTRGDMIAMAFTVSAFFFQTKEMFQAGMGMVFVLLGAFY
eukprot:gene29354-11066_t